MEFRKGKRKKDHFSMSTRIFEDKTISLKAKGLLAEMLSFPDEWEYSISGLIQINKESESAITSAIKELEKAGYLIRAEVRDERGRFKYIYSVFDTPQKIEYEKPENTGDNTDLPYPDFPGAEKPGTENQGQYNNIYNNIHTINSLDNINTLDTVSKKERSSSYDEILEKNIKDEKVKAAMLEYIKMRKLIKKPLTNYALESLIEKLYILAGRNYKLMADIVKAAILNSWTDFYPPRGSDAAGVKDKKPAFNNFNQRDYDLSDLENKLCFGSVSP